MRAPQVWVIELDSHALVQVSWSLLDPEERWRASRMQVPDVRRRFVAAHGAMRIILARQIGVDPAEVPIVRNCWGRPEIASHPSVPFNLSHSHELAVFASAEGGELGVDVEWYLRRQKIKVLNMARRFFSPEEYADLSEVPEDALQKQFLICWTRKEAYVKAKGLGLRLPLDQFTVTCRSNQSPVLQSSHNWPEDIACYRFWDIPVPDYYHATLAYGAPQSLEYQDQSPGVYTFSL